MSLRVTSSRKPIGITSSGMLQLAIKFSREFSWSKAPAIFARDNKRFHHLGVDKVAVELVELRQPEVVTAVV